VAPDLPWVSVPPSNAAGIETAGADCGAANIGKPLAGVVRLHLVLVAFVRVMILISANTEKRDISSAHRYI
jgi:hypothetical protein